jgi:hypothetical protein
MAARTRKLNLDDAWRQKIQTSMLVNRLQDHALGIIELTAPQIRSIEILLRKTAPDLTAMSLDVDPETFNLIAEALDFVAGKTQGLPDADGEATGSDVEA